MNTIYINEYRCRSVGDTAAEHEGCDDDRDDICVERSEWLTC